MVRDRCGADQPLEEEGGDGGIESRPPVGIREEGAEPGGDCGETLRGSGRSVCWRGNCWQGARGAVYGGNGWSWREVFVDVGDGVEVSFWMWSRRPFV